MFSPGYVIALVGALATLLWWSSDRASAAARAQRGRETQCPHRPEWQETIRVNSNRLGWIVPGRRMLVKHCRGCGRQRRLYAPVLQSWDSYLAEFRQETRDRTAEFRAREREHRAELARARRVSAGAERGREARRGRSGP